MNRISEQPNPLQAFEDHALVLRALRAGVREAIRRHKQAGCPMVIWRDGHVVKVPPEEIVIPDED